MAVSGSNRALWEEIEQSESYLVSCMFEEAASTTSFVLRDLCCSKFARSTKDPEFSDMLESASMVLVQSLKELGRTREILNELKLLFGSVTAIPIDIFIAGVCFQIWEGPDLATRELLEEFLNHWIYVDKQYYVLASAKANVGYTKEESDHCFVLGVEKYLEVVEIYVVTFLGMTLRDQAEAIWWVEKASLPDQKRQELLRRLNSLHPPNVSGSSQASVLALPVEHKTQFSLLKDENMSEGSLKVVKAHYPSKGENDMKQEIMKIFKQRVPCFWWFHTITLKLGSWQLVLSNGKIVLSCFVVLVCYLLRKKQVALRRTIRGQALSLRKALMDLWQLAFSYQVNPLATIEPLPSMARGSR